MVKIIHGLKDMGNNMIHPSSTIFGHIGIGKLAFFGILNHVEALLSIQFNMPTGQELTACINIEQLCDLQGDGSLYEGIRVFIPIPFFQKAIIESGSTCLIKLIFEVRKAYTEYYNKVGALDPTINEVDLHIERLEGFLWGIAKGEVDGTSFKVNPDDIEQQVFSRAHHNNRILQGGRVSSSGRSDGGPLLSSSPGTTRRTGATPNVGSGDQNLAILTDALARVTQDQILATTILEKMHQHKITRRTRRRTRRPIGMSLQKNLF